MDNFTVFGSTPTYASNRIVTAKERAAQTKEAKAADAAEKKKIAEKLTNQNAIEAKRINAGLVKINATHGLSYNPETLTYNNRAGKRRRPTRRSRKTKSKRRKTRRRR